MTELQRVAIRGIGVSPQQQFLSPLVAPLCVSLATRDTVTVLRWTSHSIRGQGNQIYVSFSLRGIPAALLRVPPNSLRARSRRRGMLPLPIAATRLLRLSRCFSSYGHVLLQIMVGVLTEEGTQVASLPPFTLLSLPGGRREGCPLVIAGHGVGGTNWEDRGWVWAFQLGSKSGSTWPLPLAAKSHQLLQNNSFVSP